MKNFVGTFVITVEDEVEAIVIAKEMGKKLGELTNSKIPEGIEIGPPGEPRFWVSSEGGILFKNKKGTYRD
jgi:hypothetical protein